MRNLAHKIVILLITFFAIASCADKGEEFVPTLAITASDGSTLDGRTIVGAKVARIVFRLRAMQNGALGVRPNGSNSLTPKEREMPTSPSLRMRQRVHAVQLSWCIYRIISK